MKIKGKAIFLSVMLCLAFLFYLKVSATIEEYTFMDNFMNKELHPFYCKHCHVYPDNLDPNIIDFNATLIENITPTCMRGDKNITINGIGCHSKIPQPNNKAPDLGRSHPVDIEPNDDMKILEDLDLHLEENKLTCVTCHDPLSDPISTAKWVGGTYADEDAYKTYFLRRKNIDSSLCYLCHQDKF